MTATTRALAARHAELMARSAAQREELAQRHAALGPRLQRVDHGLAVIWNWARDPVVLGMGVALLFAVGGSRSLRKAATASLAVLTTGMQIRNVLVRGGRGASPDQKMNRG